MYTALSPAARPIKTRFPANPPKSGTEVPAYSDTLGTWKKCHCNPIVTVTRGSLETNQPFGTCQKCHCKQGVTVNSVTVSGEICIRKPNSPFYGIVQDAPQIKSSQLWEIVFSMTFEANLSSWKSCSLRIMISHMSQYQICRGLRESGFYGTVARFCR